MSGPSGRIDAARAPSSRGRSLAWFAALGALVFGLDQLTKLLAEVMLLPGRPVPLLGGAVRLSLVHNAGAAFGLAAFGGGVLIAVGVLFCLAIPALLLRRTGWSVPQVALLALVWGGSAGNLLDRLRLGAVVDFIDLRVWPVFNVADIAITAGFALLAVRLLRSPARSA